MYSVKITEKKIICVDFMESVVKTPSRCFFDLCFTLILKLQAIYFIIPSINFSASLGIN